MKILTSFHKKNEKMGKKWKKLKKRKRKISTVQYGTGINLLYFF
jgi:DMSO/TMAO reductase YedYZ heme-binding membrane subunit